MNVDPGPSRKLIASPSSAVVCADALTRIPIARFLGLAWARDSIAACSALLAQAAGGDRAAICRWVIDARAYDDEQARYAVLRALSDALIAEAFAARGEIDEIAAVLTLVDSDVLHQLARARATNSAQRTEALHRTDLAAALVRLVGLRDPQTTAHLQNVAALAARIATAMGLGTQAVRTIELAANLHDIGNAGVDSALLAKAGPLEPAQRRAVESHAEDGARALQDVPALAFLAPIVRAHHERIDGAGYPDGLSGEDIPLAARVIAVADAYTAMTSARAYRSPLAPSEALTRLAANSGTQFDAGIVETTLAVFGFAHRSRRAIA